MKLSVKVSLMCVVTTVICLSKFLIQILSDWIGIWKVNQKIYACVFFFENVITYFAFFTPRRTNVSGAYSNCLVRLSISLGVRPPVCTLTVFVLSFVDHT